MKKSYTIEGIIHNISDITGTLKMTLEVGRTPQHQGTYVDMAVGDVPFDQEILRENIGKRIKVYVEAELL